MAYRRIEGYSRGKPDIGWWRRQIAQGIDYRKKQAMESRWKVWREYYRGKWPADVIPVNLFYKMVRTVVPRVYFRNPSISVQATKPGYEQQVFAQLIERIDNKLIRIMDTKNQMKKMIHNAWFFGTAAGKLGFGSQYSPSPDPFSDDGGAPTRASATFNRKVEWNQLVAANMPWFLSVHPGNFVVPAKLDAFENTPWVGMRLIRGVDDIKADPRFENTAQLRGSNTGLNALPRAADSNPNEIELWEVRDMRTGKVIVLPAYGCDEYLYYDEDTMQVNGRPNIYPLVFNPDDESFWGVPDSIYLEPMQLELNETRTLQMRHRRISLIKILYKSGAIELAELEKLMGGDVGIGIRVNNSGELSDVDMFQTGTIPEALFAADQTIQQDVRDIMGFSRNQSGEFAGQKSHSAPTAFEAQVVAQAAEIRIDERKDLCADVLVKIFEDVNVTCFDNWTDEQVVQVMGPQSVPLWVAFKPQMLKAARTELLIDPDSTVPETKDVRRAKADAVYNTLKSNPLIDPDLLTKYYLREMHGVQYDNLIRTMQQNAAAGMPGSTPDMPMDVNQFMSMMMNAGGQGAPSG